MNMYYERNRIDPAAILLTIGVVGIIAFCVFIVVDRMTGTSGVIAAKVIDKAHRTETHTEKDKNGHTTTHTHDYYYIYYHRKDGKQDRYDVGWWNYSKYTVGQQIVVDVTIGGKSGMEYVCGIRVWEGGEVP